MVLNICSLNISVKYNFIPTSYHGEPRDPQNATHFLVSWRILLSTLLTVAHVSIINTLTSLTQKTFYLLTVQHSSIIMNHVGAPHLLVGHGGAERPERRERLLSREPLPL